MSAAVASELSVLEKRAKVVSLAKTGMNYRAIAAEVGYKSPASVADQIAAWAAETRPSAEATEELRKLQGEQIDALFEGLWPQREDVVVVDRLVKLMDRKARLFGLDLERNVQVNLLPTAEQLAGLFGWDDQNQAPLAIDGTATEITEETPDA